MKCASYFVVSAVVAGAGLGLFRVCASPQAGAPSLAPMATTSLDKNTRQKVADNYGRLPLLFEENQGQTDARVKFLARGMGYALFLTPDGAVFNLAQGQTAKPDSHSASRRPEIQTTVLQAKLVGANTVATVSGEAPLPSTSNYLIGSDQSKWHTNVKQYGRVRYSGVYPGVDIVYYGNQRTLEYDFVLAPGADFKNIRLSYSGAEQLSLNDKGDLIITTATGELTQHKPVIYQMIDGKRQNVAGRFVIGKEHDVAFQVASYDTTKTLTIDPQLAYSTFIGGTGTDTVAAIAVDSSGNAYITGQATSSNFPTTYGALKTSKGANPTIFVAKLNAWGSSLIYSTFLGTSNGTYSDGSSAIAVDASGNTYVTGGAYSSDFPITAGAFQTTKRGSMAAPFVTKLNASGNGLIYSTFLTGSNGNVSVRDLAKTIAVAADGTAFVGGSRSTADFPVTSNAFQKTGGNAFVTRINATGSALVYSTYLGGNGGEEVAGIAVDASGNAYVVGSTASSNFPVTAGAVQTLYHGQSAYQHYGTIYGDAFVAKINPTASALIYSTYLGGSGDEVAADIAIDSAGNAYVTGSTTSVDFPVTSGAFQSVHLHSTFIPSSVAFVTKLNPAGHALVYSTYLGGSKYDYAASIAVDSSGNAHVVGSTTSTDFPITGDALQKTFAGGISDAFVSKLNPAGNGLVYSTYLGGQTTNWPTAQGNFPPPYMGGNDGATAVAVDACGSAYVVGQTNSSDFPTTLAVVETFIGNTPGAALLTPNITNGFVTKIIAGGSPTPMLNVGPLPTLLPAYRIGVTIGSTVLGVNC